MKHLKFITLFSPPLSEFKKVISHILKTIDAKRIVQIGASMGKHTEELLHWVEAQQGELDCIDTYFWDDKIENIIATSSCSRLYLDNSLDVLPTLPAADAYIIDGDHNYYTVLNELKMAWELNSKAKKPFIAFVRGVSWPFEKRDAYYNPSAIPSQFLKPHTWMRGILPENEDTVPEGLLLNFCAVATTEGGPHNGVLPAFWDFIKACHGEVKGTLIPAFLGLGVIYSQKAEWSSEIEKFLQSYNHELINQQEEYRLKLLTEFSVSQQQLIKKERQKQNATFDEDSFFTNMWEGKGKKKGLGLVSVVIPTFNRPKLVSEAIKSVCAQTYQDLEILVVNDAGKNIEDLIDNFKDKRIRYIEHETNQGLSSARNTGLKHAQGKYIAYLDDDDLYSPIHLESLVNALNQSDYKVAYSDLFRVYRRETNGILHTFMKRLDQNNSVNKYSILVSTVLPPVTLLHERVCIEEAGLFDPSLKRYEDWDFMIRMAQKFAFLHVPLPTVEYAKTIGYEQMVKGWAGHFLSYVLLLHKRYDFLTKNKISIQKAQLEFRNKYRYWAYTQLEAMTDLQFNQLDFQSIGQEILKNSLTLGNQEDIQGAYALLKYIENRKSQLA